MYLEKKIKNRRKQKNGIQTQFWKNLKFVQMYLGKYKLRILEATK